MIPSLSPHLEINRYAMEEPCTMYMLHIRWPHVIKAHATYEHGWKQCFSCNIDFVCVDMQD